MHIIDVIPLVLYPRANGPYLSYFHSEPLKRGAVVEVSLGRRTIIGIVAGSDPLSTRKRALRKDVAFEIKKLKKVISHEPQVFDWQFKIAQHMADYYYAPLGVCLKSVLPPFFNKRGYGLKKSDNSNVSQKFILCAEMTKVRYFAEKYKSQNPVIISSTTKNKDYYRIWNDVQSGKTKLVIGTRVGLFLPFANLTEIEIDDPESDLYKSDMLPRYHGADLAKHVAEMSGAHLFPEPPWPPPAPKPHARPSSGNKHTPSLSPVSIIDMVREIKDANYSIFSRQLKEVFYQTLENKQHLILYIPRRGHANFLYCQTCGKSLTCPNCSASLVLHKVGKEERLMCHHCDHRQAKPKQCPSCNAYALKSKGIGIDKVVSELKKFFDYQNLDAPRIYQLDSDTTGNNDAKEEKIIGQFLEDKPSILVTTQIIFSHQYALPKITNAAVVNADTLIKIPDFRSEESLLNQLEKLSSMTDHLHVQTYNKDNPVLQALTTDKTKQWRKDEDTTRKQFNYPPYSQLIKLTYRHRDSRKAQNEVKILYSKLKQVLSRSKIQLTLLPPFAGFVSRERGQSIWHILIKSNASTKDRNNLLDYVPQGWIIDVDPKTAI